MNQHEAMTALLKRNALVMGAAIVIAGLLAGGTWYMASQAVTEKKRVEQELSSQQSKLQQMQQQNKLFFEIKPIVEKLALEDGKQTISRAKAAALFDTLRKEYALDAFKADLGGVTEETDATLKNTYSQGLSIAISAEGIAYSDKDVMEMIDAMATSLEVLRVTELSLTPTGESGASSRVKFVLKAQWYGIKQLASSSAPAAPPAAGGTP